MRTYEETFAQYIAECDIIADQCSEEGYPSHGSNYELRVEAIQADYPEIFDPYYYDDDPDWD